MANKFNQIKNNFIPKATPTMHQAVSDYRRGTLTDEVEAGYFTEGSSGQMAKRGITAAGNVLSLVKNAQFSSGGQGSGHHHGGLARGWQGANDSIRQLPEIYSPLWLNSNLNLPRDRATINAWCRAFYALNPIVHNAIQMHSSYPISKLNIKCKNKKIESFFNQMAEELDLLNVCSQIAQEFYLLGESFVFTELDEANRKWSKILILNPDYIVLKNSPMPGEPIMMMRPDERLKKIVQSNKLSDLEQKKQLNPMIIDRVRRGENIPLNNLYTSHIARKISPYDPRGTGLPVSTFRALMLMDMFRECKYAQAQDMVNPITVVKVGSADYKATPEDLETWRNTFEMAANDRNFKIFTHEGVAIERVGANSAILDTSNDITQLLKEIYAGLMIPSIIIDGGGDISYANGGVSLDVLRMRYMSFREKMSAWLRRKIFAPISIMNEFYEYDGKNKKLIIPEIEWNHMSLFDAMDYIGVLKELADKDKGLVSRQSLYRSLGLDYEDEIRKRRKEAIDDAVLEKEKKSLEHMSLTELRSFGKNDEEEIPEHMPNPVMGEESDSSTPGEDASGGSAPSSGGEGGAAGGAGGTNLPI